MHDKVRCLVYPQLFQAISDEDMQCVKHISESFPVEQKTYWRPSDDMSLIMLLASLLWGVIANRAHARHLVTNIRYYKPKQMSRLTLEL